MTMYGKAGIVCLLSGIFVLMTGAAEANKSSVVIQEPVTFNESGRAVIQFVVRHSGNNFLHHTEWLRVSADGREIAHWDFSWYSKPESAVFMREVAVDAASTVAIEAEASCNIHGSAGPARMTISPADKTK